MLEGIGMVLTMKCIMVAQVMASRLFCCAYALGNK